MGDDDASRGFFGQFCRDTTIQVQQDGGIDVATVYIADLFSTDV